MKQLSGAIPENKAFRVYLFFCGDQAAKLFLVPVGIMADSAKLMPETAAGFGGKVQGIDIYTEIYKTRNRNPEPSGRAENVAPVRD